MKPFYSAMSGIFLGAFALISASSANESEVEFMVQEKCTSCHDSEIYTRTDGRVNSLKELGTMVRACNTNTGAQWFEDETDKVIEYLNKTYYKFGTE